MDASSPIEPERLLAQTAWVKRLALSLARDEASADDLVQESMVAALRRPPTDASEESSLRAWFSTVTRNMAFRETRERGRREQRERASARDELEQSKEHVLELEELRAELVRHVMKLDAELQQVVLLHFFEERSSAEIARDLGVADSTVRNRLRRGLAELRERLQRAHGTDWRNLCLFVIPGATTKSAATAASAALFVMGNGWLLAGALVLLAGSSWFAASGARASALQSEPVSATNVRSSALVESAPVSDASAKPARELVRPQETTAAATLFCQGEIRSSAGGTVELAHVVFRDAEGVQIATDERAKGWYAVGGLAPGHYKLEFEAQRFRKRALEVDLPQPETLSRAGAPARVDVVLEPTILVQVRFVDEKGERIPRKQFGESLEREKGVAVIATRDRPTELLPPSRGSHIWSELGYWISEATSGRAALELMGPDSSGVIEIRGDLPCYVSLAVRDRVLETRSVVRADELVDLHLDVAALALDKANARVRFVDARGGAPLVGLQVELNPGGSSGSPKPTDADGVVVFENQPLLPLELEYSDLVHAVQLHAGAETDLGTIAVPPKRTIRARIVDEEGKSIAGNVIWSPIDPAAGAEGFESRHFWSVAAGGVVPVEAPALRLRLQARPSDARRAWVCVGTIVEPGLEPLDIELHAVRGVEFELAWRMRQAADYQLLFLATDGAPCLRTYAHGDGSQRLRMVAGEYSVEVWDGTRRISGHKITVAPNVRRLELEL